MGMTKNNFTFIEDATVPTGKLINRGTQEGIYKKIINGLEIDWNKAVFPDGNPSSGGPTSPISDTVELFDLINTMQKEIYVLTAAVIALAQR